MLQQTITSWGRVLKHSHHVFNIAHRFSLLPNVNHEFGTLLPYGNGRSYGDSALNVGGTLIKTDALHHFMAFDPSTGVFTHYINLNKDYKDFDQVRTILKDRKSVV